MFEKNDLNVQLVQICNPLPHNSHRMETKQSKLLHLLKPYDSIVRQQRFRTLQRVGFPKQLNDIKSFQINNSYFVTLQTLVYQGQYVYIATIYIR
ncbi:MAG TPA: hypothetical protein DG754_13000 [Bacteroidales bacterium]|nr:hypothetical protein [Bacteroidales bacterium]